MQDVRDIQEMDAERKHWVEIQQATFTNWINEELRSVTNKLCEIKDIQTDLQDGLALITLVKSLHTKSIHSTMQDKGDDKRATAQALVPVHENPKTVFEMCENLKSCLNFMKEQKFYGIDSTDASDIYNGRLNLILGLVYSLIYRYHIQRKVQASPSQGKVATSSKSVNVRPIKALKLWINWQICKRFPDMKRIHNLTRDWNDGLALCALIESIEEGACGELPKFDKVRNCEIGLDLGSERFKIPKIISAEHLADPDVDETSVMIYLCYYLQHCFKSHDSETSHQNKIYIEQVPRYIVKFLDDVGLVAIPSTKEELLFNVKMPTDATQCDADLNFLKQSVFEVGQTIVFRVDCADAGDKGKLEITAGTGTNDQIKTDFRAHKKSKKLFNCFVKAEMVGIHELSIRWGEKDDYDHIEGSPFNFTVCNPKAVTFDSEKTRHFAYVGDTIEFGVDISKAAAGSNNMLHAEFSDKKMGYETIKSDGKVTFIYTADEAHTGPSELFIFFNGIKIKIIEIVVARDYLKANPKMEARATVFINYINYVLVASGGEEVSDLQRDFQSGVILALLLKSLSGTEIEKLATEPESRVQMMQNLNACFNFMKSLKLDLHDIKEEHIYNGEGEVILKVLWEIIKFYHIYHYRISETVEELMLVWFQAVLSEPKINNFLGDWCDGTLLCLLIERLEPGLCPQYSMLQKSSARVNCELAIKHAKNRFGIPDIISADMMQNGDLDEKCMMIYLVFFIQHAMKLLLVWLRVILPDRNINNLTMDWCDGKNLIALCNALSLRVLSTWHVLDDSESAKDNCATAMKALKENLGVDYSQIISPDLFSEGQTNQFRNSAYLFCLRYAVERVDADKCKLLLDNQHVNVGDPIKLYLKYSGGGTGEVTQYGLDPQSNLLMLQDPVEKQQTYYIESGPTKLIGEYKIAIYWNKMAIAGSPFTIYAGSPKKVDVKSLPDSMTVGEVVVFEIDARRAGNGIIIAKAINLGNGKEDIIFKKTCNHEMVKERYTPPGEGTTEFIFTFNGIVINRQKCTFVPVATTSNQFIAIYAEYCKLQHNYSSNDHCLNNPNKPVAAVKFSVDVTDAGTGSLDTTVTVDGAKNDDIQINSSVDKSKGVRFFFSFLPQKLQRHTVSVRWNGHEIPGSPFEVNVIDHCKCKPNKNDLPLKSLIDGKYGKAFLNKEIKFKVDTNGAGNGILQSIISQLGHKSMTLTPTSISKSGEYTFVYKPCELGRFDIILRYSKTNIETYQCYTVPTITPGAGVIVLPSHFALLAEPYEFYMWGSPSYTAVVYDPQNEKVIPKMKSSSLACFTPKLTGSYMMFELDNGKCVPNSSSVIHCIYPRKCKLLEILPKYLQVGEATELKVSIAGAGLGILSVLINGKEDDQMCTAIVNTRQDNHLCCITLKPKLTGRIFVQILYAGMPIHNFNKPLKVRVCDAKRCKIVMKTDNCLVGNHFSFTLFTAGAGSGKAIVKAFNSSNHQNTVHIIKNKNGSLQCTLIPADVGEYLVDVIWGAAHVPGSPFKIIAEKPAGVYCLAMGSGLNKAIAGKPAIFYVTTKNGSLESKDLFVNVREINRHHKVNMHIKETSAGHCVEYIAPSAGEYVAEIKRCGEEIIFSPFKIDVVQGADASKCEIKLKEYTCTDNPIRFYVDISEGGNGILTVTVKDPHNKELDDVYVKQGRNDKVRVTFIAKCEGAHSVSVLWSNDHVPGSPFMLNVCYLEAANKVYAHGQGLRNGRLGETAEFIIESKDAGQGKPIVNGVSAEGFVDVQVVQNESGIYKASYKCFCIGHVYINVKWGENQTHIPGSPFRVSITTSDTLPHESVSKSDFQVVGLPLESAVSLNTDVTFTVNTRSILQGKVESKISRPGQRSIILTPINDEGTMFQYRPCEAGRFFITLRYSIISVGMSPYACIAIGNSNNKSTGIGVISMPDCLALYKKPYRFYIQGSPTYTAVVYDPNNIKVKLSKQPQSPVVEFFPDCIGSYIIFEEQNHQLIPNSHCLVRCIDPSRCKVLGDLPKYLQVGRTKEFIVTSADAGLGALTVEINNDEDTPLCTAVVSTHQNSRSHKVTLKPRFVGEVFIKLFFEGLAIQQLEEPFKVNICDASKCKIIMPNNHCIFGEQFTFTLITKNAGFGKVNFRVQCPDHQLSNEAISIIDNRDGTFQCTFTPVDIGKHLIDVIWGIDHVKGCPFTVIVERPAGKLCLAIGSGLNKATVGKPAKFYITAVNGSLNRKDLDISITANQHECKVNIDETSDKYYDISYIAPKVGWYEAKIKYCDEEIVFSPFKIMAVQGADASKCEISGINPEGTYYMDLIEFMVDTSKGGDGSLRVVVTDQYDNQLAVFMRENNQQHYVAFIPEAKGTHTISVLWSEAHVPQSPLKLYIDQSVDMAADLVYAYGQGLRSGILGELAAFTIVTKNAGKGDLEINGFSSKGGISIDREPAEGIIQKASYKPENIGDISISIKWCGIPIPGSPFIVCITPQAHNTRALTSDLTVPEEINQSDFEIKGIPLRNNIAYLNMEVVYTVNITNRNIRHDALKSYISFLDHKNHAIVPIKQRNGEYKFKFTPNKVGTFEIAVCYSNTHLHESPFKCTAINPHACGVIYIPSNIAQVGVPYEFYVQGDHSYSAVLYDPQNEKVRNLELFKEKSSTIARFTPMLIGSYAIFEESKGLLMPNSYTFNCVDPNKCKMLGDLSKFLQVGKVARFKVISRDAGPGVISVQCDDEENSQACTKMVETSHYVHTVTLKPVLVGSISIKVAFSGISIPKSPMKIEICDAYQCRVLGDLTGQYPAGKEISFRLLTAGAGCGKATVKVQSPTKHEYSVDTIEFEKDVLGCAFTPIEIGDHLIYVMWGIEHILGSPFSFTVVKSSEVVCIAGLEHLRWAITNVPAKFSIQAREGGLLDIGALSVSIKSVHSEAQVKSEDVGDGIYDVIYIAPKKGSYRAEIKYCDQCIVGSPFKIDVFDTDVTDTAEENASKCHVTKIRSEDVHYTNTSQEFFIDTTQAGNCTPEVTITDPNNQQVINTFIDDNIDGYVVKFIPEIQGIYTIIILISGHHVRGSPFNLHCVTRNAKMVKAEGEGLSRGKLGEWAEFTVDTENAGQGLLTITAVSKKGKLKDIEKYLKHEGSSKYIGRYYPQVAGEILITIKWSDVDIPNSPFKAIVSDHSGYEPLGAARDVIANNPAFISGPDLDDEDDAPENISSYYTDSEIDSEYDTDSDEVSSTTDLLLYPHQKSGTTVIAIGDEVNVRTSVFRQSREHVNHYLHLLIIFIFPPWLIVWVVLCCIYGC